MKNNVVYSISQFSFLVLLFLLLLSCNNKQSKNTGRTCNELHIMLFQTYDSLEWYSEEGNEHALDLIIRTQDSIIKIIQLHCGISHEIIDLIYTRNLYLRKYDEAIDFLEEIPDTSYALPYGKILKIGVLKLFKVTENTTTSQTEYSRLENDLTRQLSNFRKTGDSLLVDVSIEYVKNIKCSPELIKRRISYIRKNPDLFYGSDHEYFISVLDKLIQLKRNQERGLSSNNKEKNEKLKKEEFFEVLE